MKYSQNYKYKLSIIVFTLISSILNGYEYSKPTEKLDYEILRSDLSARVVELTHIFEYTNVSDQAVTLVYHKVSMPPCFSQYQVLLDVTGDLVEKAELKQHENGIDHYLMIGFPVGAQSRVRHVLSFKVLLLPVDYMKKNPEVNEFNPGEVEKRYLHPSKYNESDAEPIVRIARGMVNKAGKDIINRTKLAYAFPAGYLKFKPQDTKGALAALQSGNGDCTEYSALTVSICRAMEIPARQTGVFHIRKQKEQHIRPNHIAAEVYWGNLGWFPIDPNLGGGRTYGDYGFGKMGNSVVLLKREGCWTWSNRLPRNGYDNSKPKPILKPETSWVTTVVDEGPAKEMVEKYYNKRKR